MTKQLILFFIGTLLLSCQPKRTQNIAYYVNLGGEPTTLHPLNGNDGYNRTVRSYIHETLLSQDIETFEWKPALATKWKVSEDKREFTFTLRDNVFWHDGEPLTVEDVKWSFDAIFDDRFRAAVLRPYYEGIEKVEIVDERTVKFIAKTNYYRNFDIAAGLNILPKHFYEQDEPKAFFNRNLLGTGPYKLALYNRGNRIVLERNEDWWGNEINTGEWNFEKVVLRFVQDRNVALEMLKKGSFDFINLQPEDYVRRTNGEEWGKSLHKVKTYNKTPKGYNFIGWNLTHPILKDREVRKALYHLVDRKHMIDMFEYGYSVPATGPVYPGSPYYDDSIKPVEYDPKKALAMLRKAGWNDTDGDNVLDKVIDGRKHKLSITILEPYEGFMRYLTVFQENARRVGVEINIKLIEWSSFIKLIDERKFDAVRLAWSASVDWDPKQIWHSSSIDGGSNFISYSNPEVDRLTDEARMIHDRDERIKMLNKVLKLIVDDYPYVWFTYKDATMYAHTDRILKEQDTYQYGIGDSFWKFKDTVIEVVE